MGARAVRAMFAATDVATEKDAAGRELCCIGSIQSPRGNIDLDARCCEQLTIGYEIAREQYVFSGHGRMGAGYLCNRLDGAISPDLNGAGYHIASWPRPKCEVEPT